MRYGFGVDIQGTNIRFGFFEETGKLVEKWELVLRGFPDSNPILPAIAQEVEQAIADAGLADTDLAVVVQENHGTDDAGKYGVRYEEFIALNMAMIQKLMDENDALRERIAALEGGNDAT